VRNVVLHRYVVDLQAEPAFVVVAQRDAEEGDLGFVQVYLAVLDGALVGEVELRERDLVRLPVGSAPRIQGIMEVVVGGEIKMPRPP